MWLQINTQMNIETKRMEGIQKKLREWIKNKSIYKTINKFQCDVHDR